MTTAANIAFLGTGNMARAIIGGLINSGYPAEALYATARSPGKLDDLAAQGVNTGSDNLAAIANADVVLLCVKPQGMLALIDDLKEALIARQPLIISVAAGITLSTLEKELATTLPIVRCMPNTPSLVGLGASGLYANEATTNDQRQQAESILAAVGLAVWVNSDAEMDSVTAVSGSGPAYYFMVMESMIAAATQLGLSESVARQLTLQTALGAATMASQSEFDPAELRKRVTSPNGTTERAINSFNADQLPEIFEKAMTACRDRSAELAEQLSQR